jgi:hypothetical protein
VVKTNSISATEAISVPIGMPDGEREGRGEGARGHREPGEVRLPGVLLDACAPPPVKLP